MEPIARRKLLKLFAGVGAAAACGLSIPGPAEAAEATEAPSQPADVSQAVAETVESEMQPNQFYIVRRRRFYRRPRRVYFVRRPRRVYYIRRRPRRYFVRRRRYW